MQAGTLTIEVQSRFGGAPLVFDQVVHTNAAGQALSVTRLDLLLSGFGLQRADGTWLELSNQFAYVSLREGRAAFQLEDVSAEPFTALRLHVGLPPEINNGDPARYPPEHPLNPNVNGMHWSWLGGYIFLAIEGLWRSPEGKIAGYSFHLATDRELMTEEVPLAGTEARQALALDVARIFGGEAPVVITLDAASTHSRPDDGLAVRLRRNVEAAFSVGKGGEERLGAASPSMGDNAKIVMTPGATPYRFAMSAKFPIPDLPRDNPLTAEGVELGRQLFHETRLATNDAQSCASCHLAGAAFADPGKRYSTGAEGAEGKRNAMPLFNLAWKPDFFWDGRAASLREQVIVPIQQADEMHTPLVEAVARLAATTNYPALFARAFGSEGITAERMALALEQFLLTSTSYDSRFDRAMKAASGNSFMRAMGDRATLTEEEKRGFELFSTEYDPRRGFLGADCFHCHGGPLFSNHGFANNGLDAEFKDAGRFLATGREGDRGKFAVPSLRNVAVTAPYMHDGRFATLEEAVEHYRTGVQRSATLDPNLAKHPDGGVPFSDEEKRALVAFLKTLTDSRWEGAGAP